MALIETALNESEQEWFSHGFGLYSTNVSLIRRLIASGKITPMVREYKVKEMAEAIFPNVGDDYKFGSNDFSRRSSFDIMGPPVSPEKMADIPEDKFEESVLFVMWDTDEAMRIAGIEPKNPVNQERAQIIDGNHRLMARYLRGDTGMVKAEFVSFEDALRCSQTRGMNMGEIRAQSGQ